MAGWRRRPSPEAGTRLARLLGPASWSGLQLPPGRQGGTTLSRVLSGREQPAASRPPVCWCVRGDRRGPGHGRQRPMYNSSQEKKTVARPEGLLLPLGTPGRDSPCPWRKGLQRPLELVPRQVLPDGGLGAGGIPQFSPDHLGQRGGVSGAPRPPEPTAATHVPPRAPRPQSPEARRGQRPRRHTTILVATPVMPSESPLGRRLGLGLPSGPGDPGGSRRGGLRPAPRKALAQPRGTTLPRWLLQGSRHASVRRVGRRGSPRFHEQRQHRPCRPTGWRLLPAPPERPQGAPASWEARSQTPGAGPRAGAHGVNQTRPEG